MIDPERRHFEEIKERGKGGTLLADDFEWLAEELDSYSKAWKTAREDLRKLSDANIKLARIHEQTANALQGLIDRVRHIESLQSEVGAAEKLLREGL